MDIKMDKRYAVLIDADNVSEKYIDIILEEVSNYGVATTRRIYGDWTKTGMTKWKKSLLENSIIPVQQYSYTTGKNSTDSAMIIDAMDILYSGKVDGFCLVSSDSDFTRLASRIREAGLDVVGMGETKTPPAFISACTVYRYLDLLAAESFEEEVSNKPVSNVVSKVGLKKVKKAMKNIVQENSDGDGWMNIGDLGNKLQKRFPDFDVRNYGYKKFSLFVENCGLFEIKKEAQIGGTGVTIYAKEKK